MIMNKLIKTKTQYIEILQRLKIRLAEKKKLKNFNNWKKQIFYAVQIEIKKV